MTNPSGFTTQQAMSACASIEIGVPVALLDSFVPPRSAERFHMDTTPRIMLAGGVPLSSFVSSALGRLANGDAAQALDALAAALLVLQDDYRATLRRG